MNSAELEKFVAEAIALRAKRQAASLPGKESELLLAINNGVSADVQWRFEELVAKRRGETLLPAEHLELLQLTNRIENADAKRIKGIARLAEIRGKTFDEIAAEIGIGQIKNV